jgi:hypothetical protein
VNLRDANAVTQDLVNFMLVQKLTLIYWDRLLLGHSILLLFFSRLYEVFDFHSVLVVSLLELAHVLALLLGDDIDA